MRERHRECERNLGESLATLRQARRHAVPRKDFDGKSRGERERGRERQGKRRKRMKKKEVF